ncbi:MAG: hypothetical protein ABWY93_07955 [Mycobacterium sp.]
MGEHTTPDRQDPGNLRKAAPGEYHSDTILHCPHCGHGFNGFGTVDGSDGRGPQDGDYTCCIRCAGVMRFIAGPFGTLLRAATGDETAEYERVAPGARGRVRLINRQLDGRDDPGRREQAARRPPVPPPASS